MGLVRVIDHMQRLTLDPLKEARQPTLALGTGVNLVVSEDRLKAGAAAAQRQVEAAADQQVRGAGSLRQQDGVLIAHGDHSAAQRDALGVLAGGGKEREGGREIVVEVPLIGPAGLVSEPLSRLEQRYRVTQAPLGATGSAVEGDARVESEPQRLAGARRLLDHPERLHRVSCHVSS
jgi:hypothetical protein